MMLRPVKPIDIEIMHHQEKQYLYRHRPGNHQVAGGQMAVGIQWLDDIVKDKDLQKIALDKGIPDKVNPKPVAENRDAPGIGIFPLQPYKDEHTQYQQAGSIINDRLHN